MNSSTEGTSSFIIIFSLHRGSTTRPTAPVLTRKMSSKTFKKYAGLSERQHLEISPIKPMLPNIEDLNGKSLVKDIHTHLYLLRRSYEYFIDTDEEEEVLSPHSSYLESPWLLVCEPISHAEQTIKGGWTKVRDYKDFKSFPHFWNEELARQVNRTGDPNNLVPAKPNNAARIGLFCSKTENWTGRGRAWLDADWHV
ncbi:uncharacterized protein LY89DRAFT_410303 [Mollisia scopiformis]|uniref:Uncharacterized protein n=1 Tax=Mollisia scopiformis TaxID=149040 RepID=A0A132B4A3_MOLSC|nr:uncharacterized protein LY89DRAFT_410303 [Mollisia scopiformis]KUJ06497.1 hypothetical protein LY89DRAFT_410303 [Mollisia scopiformis]